MVLRTSGVMLLSVFLSMGVGFEVHGGGFYSLQFPVIEVPAGDAFVFPINAEWTEPVQGYTTVFTFPPSPPIEGLEISIENTLTGESQPEFVDISLSPTTGEAILAILFDAVPPLDGTTLPPVGFPLAIAELRGTIPADVEEQSIPFQFVDGLGTPPVDNVFVVANQSVAPDVTLPGELVVVAPVLSAEYLFLRSDYNLDGSLSLLDAIGMLFWTFVPGTPPPLCEDAADADDSGHAGINDGLYLLLFLYTGGPAPPHPFPAFGQDFTPDNLACEWSPWPNR